MAVPHAPQGLFDQKYGEKNFKHNAVEFFLTVSEMVFQWVREIVHGGIATNCQSSHDGLPFKGM